MDIKVAIDAVNETDCNDSGSHGLQRSSSKRIKTKMPLATVKGFRKDKFLKILLQNNTSWY
jgi:hypothetical protein